MVTCRQRDDGALDITLSNGETIVVDHVIFATGYKVNMTRVPILAEGNQLSRLALHNGFPRLDEQFQTNIPGLFITSMPAVQDFGLFFTFTISVRASTHIIGLAISRRIGTATSTLMERI